MEIRKWLAEKTEYRDEIKLLATGEYKSVLKGMFKLNEQLFIDYLNLEISENDPNKKINVGWEQN